LPEGTLLWNDHRMYDNTTSTQQEAIARFLSGGNAEGDSK